MNRLHKFDILVAWFREFMTIGNYRPRTVEDYQFELKLLRRWLVDQVAIEDIDDIDRRDLTDYTAYLYERQLSAQTIYHKLSIIKCFFKALYDENKLYRNLADSMIIPRVRKRLPTNTLTEEETEQIFDYLERMTGFTTVENRSQAVKVRDRLFLELLYSCGLRNSEIRNLRIDSIDFKDGFLTVLEGKGGRDRVIPIGSTALALVHCWIVQARPFLATKESDPTLLLLSRRGRKVTGNTLKTVVDRTLKEVGIDKRIRVHDLRHTCATHMLNSGADIRYVQELLGHRCLSSTQVYTHVAIDSLKKSHQRYHPRERWIV